MGEPSEHPAEHTNGHAEPAPGGLSGWTLFLAGHRLWERRAEAALRRRFSAEELQAVADAGACDGIMAKYWSDYDSRVHPDVALNRLLKRVAAWLVRHGKYEE